MLGGKEYGTGSSRDWAAEGTALLGVGAVLAESFERIHRANLVGMGVLPLAFQPGEGWRQLGLTGAELFAFDGIEEAIRKGGAVKVSAREPDGVTTFEALPQLLTEAERGLLAAGGILMQVLKDFSPTFITAFGVIERSVPESMLTEGVTWVMTGIGIGIGMALGAFASGWVVDNYGPQNGFWVSVVAGAAAALTVGLGQASLSGMSQGGRFPTRGIASGLEHVGRNLGCSRPMFVPNRHHGRSSGLNRVNSFDFRWGNDGSGGGI